MKSQYRQDRMFYSHAQASQRGASQWLGFCLDDVFSNLNSTQIDQTMSVHDWLAKTDFSPGRGH